MSLISIVRRLHRESGQVLVLAILGMTALLGTSALVFDAGVATAQRRSAQSAADAAALAGASDLPGVTQANAQAVTDATTAANTNLAGTGISSPTITVNSPPINSTGHNGDTNSVEVTITAQAPVFFAGVLGIGSVTITAHAVATGAGSLGTPPIVILDPAQADSLDIGEDPGVSLTSKYQPSGGDNLACSATGTTTVQVNGPIYTNSVAADGEEVHAGCDLAAASNHSAGADQALCTDETCGQYTPPPTEGTGTQFPDPLAYLTEPGSVTTVGTYADSSPSSCTSGPPPSCIVTTGTVTVNPGVWNNLEVTGSGKLTLNAGTYVITGSLQLTGSQGSSNTGTASGTLKGVGVTLYFTCPSSVSPYWTDCPTGGGTVGQSNDAACPRDCSGTSTSSCPNKCSPGGFMNVQSGSGGTFNLQAPTSGSTQGLLVFYDRNNYLKRTGEGETLETFSMEVIGSSNDTMNGTVYAERSNGWIISNSATFAMNSCIVINSLGIYGGHNFTLSCTPAYNAIPSNVPYGGASLTE